MSAVLRCKVRVTTVSRNIDHEGKTESETVQLAAVYSGSEENKQWSKWTPSASFSLTINNPDAIGKLTKNHEFYIDFIPAPAAAS